MYTQKCLSTGTYKTINFPFIPDRKLMGFRYPNILSILGFYGELDNVIKCVHWFVNSFNLRLHIPKQVLSSLNESGLQIRRDSDDNWKTIFLIPQRKHML